MTGAATDPFSALAQAVAGDLDPTGFSCREHPAFERVRRALAEGGRGSADIAVLLRHALRYEDARRGVRVPTAVLTLDQGRWSNDAAWWGSFGLDTLNPNPSKQSIRANPWCPEWLKAASGQGTDTTAVDGASAAGEPRHFRSGRHFLTADPFLLGLGLEHYRTPGQRQAIRAAVSMPRGATLLVILPTGDGKSLVFQALDRINRQDGGRDGVTLVIVPTVTLALDHERSAAERLGPEIRAYVGGDTDRNDRITARIAEGTQGMCFASPEAACGPLRKPLLQAARAGVLKASVIDEAHLITAWGTGFRSDFQSLSGLFAELRAACPVGSEVGTVLLSATITKSSMETLRVLFSTPSRPMGVVSSVRVRPEPDYWVGRSGDGIERRRRVIEALRHLPRPAILYASKVADVTDLADALRVEGFANLRTVTGRTTAADRDETLRSWRDGHLDLVVATSAFGMGIDYPHVRSIVHACLPESFDRFYQEVGRAGRDGCAAVSVLLTAPEDEHVAEVLSRETVLSLDRGLQRWSSMFGHPDRTRLDDGRFALRLDIPPGTDERDIDMVGETSTDWNARLLALLARAGLIRLHGDASSPDRPGVRHTVEILDGDHLRVETWRQRVEPIRSAIASGNASNLSMMRRFVGGACATGLVAQLYELVLDGRTHPVEVDCGNCGSGGCDIVRSHSARDFIVPSSPWPCSPGVTSTAAGLIDHRGLCLVYYEHAEGRRWHRQLAKAVEVLMRCGVRKLIRFGTPTLPDEHLRAVGDGRPLFVATIERAVELAASGLPPGPELVIVAPGMALRKENLAPRNRGQERFIILPSDSWDADHPGRFLRDTFVGADIRFDVFLERIDA